jgi:hypothetical protein
MKKSLSNSGCSCARERRVGLGAERLNEHSIRKLSQPGQRMKFSVQRGEESELIPAIVAGEVQLYHQLICPYEGIVYVMSFSHMKNDKDAEDVAHETFIRAF